jgi:hypothetical protein
MKNKDSVCGLCGKSIEKGQSIFFFPTLPLGHNLVDIQGVLHVACLVSQDAMRNIGVQLAGMIEQISQAYLDATFVARDGNIVSRYRIHEQKFEVMDFENFCEIVIPKRVVSNIYNIEPEGSLLLGLDVLHIKEGGLYLQNKGLGSDTYLRTLSLERLLGLLVQQED